MGADQSFDSVVKEFADIFVERETCAREHKGLPSDEVEERVHAEVSERVNSYTDQLSKGHQVLMEELSKDLPVGAK